MRTRECQKTILAAFCIFPVGERWKDVQALRGERFPTPSMCLKGGVAGIAENRLTDRQLGKRKSWPEKDEAVPLITHESPRAGCLPTYSPPSFINPAFKSS